MIGDPDFVGALGAGLDQVRLIRAQTRRRSDFDSTRGSGCGNPGASRRVGVGRGAAGGQDKSEKQSQVKHFSPI